MTNTTKHGGAAFRAPVETDRLKALLLQTICGDYRAEAEASETLRSLFPDLIREVLANREATA